MGWPDSKAMVALAMFAVGGCRGDDAPAPPVDDPVHETWSVGVEVSVQPLPDLQAASLTIDAPAEAELWVSWTDGQGHEPSHAPPPGTVAMPLLGLRPDRAYTVTVTATLEGVTRQAEATVMSQPLPFHLRAELVRPASAPHFTLASLRDSGWGPPQGTEAVVVVDEEGEVVYFKTFRGRLIDARRIDGGFEVLVGDGARSLIPMSWLGVEDGGYTTAPTPPDGRVFVDAPGRFHHDYVRRGDGSIYALSSRTLEVEDYPLDYTLEPRGPATIVDGGIHHFAADGRTLGTLFLSDVLPTGRIAFDSLQPGVGGGLDWCHDNALALHPDGDLLVSLRHQDAVVKLDPDSGAIDWILGTPDNWPPSHQPYLLTPSPGLEWPFHQHAVQVADDGVIWLFDNGNYGVSPGPGVEIPDESTLRSRVVGYRVDPGARTVEQVAERMPEPSLFAYAVGDVELLADGGRVGHFGMVFREEGVANEALGRGVSSIRLIEWDAAGEEVWHLHLDTDPAVVPGGWTSYRSERFASFYD